MMTKIPQISAVFQRKHAGKSVAIFDGKIVSTGKDSLEAEQKAVAQGFPKSEIMTTFLMGTKNYVF